MQAEKAALKAKIIDRYENETLEKSREESKDNPSLLCVYCTKEIVPKAKDSEEEQYALAMHYLKSHPNKTILTCCDSKNQTRSTDWTQIENHLQKHQKLSKTQKRRRD